MLLSFFYAPINMKIFGFGSDAGAAQEGAVDAPPEVKT
jgi:hypothetical protein